MDIIKSLKLINSKSISSDYARKLNIDVMSLISKGLIKKEKQTTTRYIVPENAPRWATKFKYSRKKHGIEEDTKETIVFKLTDRGRKFLKHKPKDDKDDLPEDDLPKDEKEQPEFADFD